MTRMICLSAPQLNATSAVTLLLSTLMIIVREPDSFEGKNLSTQYLSYSSSICPPRTFPTGCEYVCRLRFRENFSTDY